jgi:2-phospho-L-lactate/phosphoenolpyruvate guanylyltransferase
VSDGPRWVLPSETSIRASTTWRDVRAAVSVRPMLLPVTVIIPIKALTQAKTRLAPGLDPDRRIELMTWMLGHVVETCRGSPSVAEIVVIAGDDAAADAAREHGVAVEIVHSPGLPAAMQRADRLLEGVPASLVVAADLPLLRSQEVEELCVAPPELAVVVAPTADGGTGGLLRRPGTVIGTAYGRGSAAAHGRLARAAGVQAGERALTGFMSDLDTPTHLRALSALEPRLAPWARRARAGEVGG